MPIPFPEFEPGDLVLVELQGVPGRPDWASDLEEATIMSADPNAGHAMVALTRGTPSEFGPIPLSRVRPVTK
jgi:hypothetical protein